MTISISSFFKSLFGIQAQSNPVTSQPSKGKQSKNSPEKSTSAAGINKGTVKFFNGRKGFGFIQMENSQEIFVHASGLRQKIRDNDKVTFDMEEGKKGMSAVNVSRC